MDGGDRDGKFGIYFRIATVGYSVFGIVPQKRFWSAQSRRSNWIYLRGLGRNRGDALISRRETKCKLEESHQNHVHTYHNSHPCSGGTPISAAFTYATCPEGFVTTLGTVLG